MEMSDDTANRRLSIKSPLAPCCPPCWPGRLTCRTATLPDLHACTPGALPLFTGATWTRSRTAPCVRAFPFEVWVNGADQLEAWVPWPRPCRWTHARQRPGRLAQACPRPWPRRSAKVPELRFPPHGEQKLMPGVVSAFAQVVRYRCEKLEALDGDLADPGARQRVQPRRSPRLAPMAPRIPHGGDTEPGDRRRLPVLGPQTPSRRSA